MDLNKNNTIQIYDVLYQTIDCSDCRNYWLFRDNETYENEGYNPRNRTGKILFDDDIVSKLKTKCKTFLHSGKQIKLHRGYFPDCKSLMLKGIVEARGTT